MTTKQYEYQDWLKLKQTTQRMYPEKLTPVSTLEKGTIHWLTPNYFQFVFNNPFVYPNLNDILFFTGHEFVEDSPIVLSVVDGYVCLGIQLGSVIE